MGTLATNPLTDPLEKICLIVFAQTTHWSHQSTHLQRYIGFRPVPTLGSHRTPTLWIPVFLCG